MSFLDDKEVYTADLQRQNPDLNIPGKDSLFLAVRGDDLIRRYNKERWISSMGEVGYLR